MSIAVRDVAWLAGLLEGEGCFSTSKRNVKGRDYWRITIQLVMTDRDVVEKAAALLGGTVSKATMPKGAVKPVYRTNVFGDRAAAWMMTLWSFMGGRRRDRMEHCIGVWKNSPGRTSAQRARLLPQVSLETA